MLKSVVKNKPLASVLSILFVSSLAAGCSADMMRFDNPFSNPFTSSTKRQSVDRGSNSNERQSFDRQSNRKLPEKLTSDDDVVTNSATRRGVEEVKRLPYNENVSKAWEGKGAVRPAVNLPKQMQDEAKRGGWSPIGGTTIQARSGESVESLSKRYGVPASAIGMANGLSSSASLSNGQSVVIPTYSINNKAVAAKKNIDVTPEKGGITGLRKNKTTQEAKAPTKVLAKPSSYNKYARSHTVAPGDTLGSLANRYSTKREDLAKANKMDEWGKLQIGQTLAIPAIKTIQVAAVKPKALVVAAKKNIDPTPTGSIGAVKTPKLKATPVAVNPQATVAKEELRQDLQFKWPVRSGRVISHFGQDLNGAENEGINIAVPEGTEVRAAEDGEVIYAGAGLKNYGNLVLIRHGEKYVTAYAHNKELLVRLNEKVKRGQAIAKAGQTGAVSSPQVHFEVRQGKSSIDPETKLVSQN